VFGKQETCQAIGSWK